MGFYTALQQSFACSIVEALIASVTYSLSVHRRDFDSLATAILFVTVACVSSIVQMCVSGQELFVGDGKYLCLHSVSVECSGFHLEIV